MPMMKASDLKLVEKGATKVAKGIFGKDQVVRVEAEARDDAFGDPALFVLVVLEDSARIDGKRLTNFGAGLQVWLRDNDVGLFAYPRVLMLRDLKEIEDDQRELDGV